MGTKHQCRYKTLDTPGVAVKLEEARQLVKNLFAINPLEHYYYSGGNGIETFEQLLKLEKRLPDTTTINKYLSRGYFDEYGCLHTYEQQEVVDEALVTDRHKDSGGILSKLEVDSRNFDEAKFIKPSEIDNYLFYGMRLGKDYYNSIKYLSVGAYVATLKGTNDIEGIYVVPRDNEAALLLKAIWDNPDRAGKVNTMHIRSEFCNKPSDSDVRNQHQLITALALTGNYTREIGKFRYNNNTTYLDTMATAPVNSVDNPVHRIIKTCMGAYNGISYGPLLDVTQDQVDAFDKSDVTVDIILEVSNATEDENIHECVSRYGSVPYYTVDSARVRCMYASNLMTQHKIRDFPELNDLICKKNWMDNDKVDFFVYHDKATQTSYFVLIRSIKGSEPEYNLREENIYGNSNDKG